MEITCANYNTIKQFMIDCDKNFETICRRISRKDYEIEEHYLLISNKTFEKIWVNRHGIQEFFGDDYNYCFEYLNTSDNKKSIEYFYNIMEYNFCRMHFFNRINFKDSKKNDMNKKVSNEETFKEFLDKHGNDYQIICRRISKDIDENFEEEILIISGNENMWINCSLIYELNSFEKLNFFHSFDKRDYFFDKYEHYRGKFIIHELENDLQKRNEIKKIEMTISDNNESIGDNTN